MASSVQPLSILSDAAYLVMQAIQAGQAAQNQKENCRRLVDRLKLLLPLLEDVKRTEIANNLAAAATFERLELALRKTKDLLERCSLPCSRVYMVIHAVPLVNLFQDVTVELHRCLTALPLVCLKASDSIRSQVAKINGDFRTVRYSVDSQTRHIASELELLVMEHRKGVRSGQDIIVQLAGQLGLHSRDIIKGEQETLERAKIAARAEKDKQEEDYLSQIISLLTVVDAEVSASRRSGRKGEGGRGEKRKPPTEYCCPLSLELMSDPVIVASGQTFERAFIERWLEQGNMSCPATRQVLTHTSFIPNEALKSSIASWCKAYNVVLPQPKKLPPNATIKGPGLVEFHAWRALEKPDKLSLTGIAVPGLDRAASANSKLKPAFPQGASRRTVRSVRFDPALDTRNETKGPSDAAQQVNVTVPAADAAPTTAPLENEAVGALAGGAGASGAAAGMVVGASIAGEGVETEVGSGVSGNGAEHAVDKPAVAAGVYKEMVPPLLVLPDQSSPAPSSTNTSPSNSVEHPRTSSGSLSPVSSVSLSSADTSTTSGTPPGDVLPAGAASCNAPGVLLPAGPVGHRPLGLSRPSRSVSDLESGASGKLDLHSAEAQRHSTLFSGGFPPVSPSGSAISGGSSRVSERFCPSPASSVSASSAASSRHTSTRYLGSPGSSSSPKSETASARRRFGEVQMSPRGPLEHTASFSSFASSQDEEVVEGGRRSMERQVFATPQASRGRGQEVEQQTFRPPPRSAPPLPVDLAEVKMLVNGLVQGTTDEKKLSAARIRQLGKSSEDSRRVLGEQGALQPLVNLLAAPESDVVESALFALLNLSISDANKAEIVTLGAVGLLVRLLKSGNEVNKEGAAGTLFSLSVMDEHKLVLATEGAIPCLVDVLVTGTRRAKLDAMSALYNLSIIAANKMTLVQSGVVKPIVYITRKGPPVFGALMVDKAVAIMSNLSFIPEGRHALAAAKAIPVLCQTVEEGGAKAKEDAAACLLRLCVGSPTHKALIWKEDVISPLMLLAHSGTPRGKNKAKTLLQELNTIR